MQDSKPKPKQCIIIMTDSQRKDMISAYNKTHQMHTPALDQLCQEGIRFEHAYTTQPVCGPARSALFTGQFPHTNGMLANSMALAQGTKTVGQRLAPEIHTAYIGKWHLDGGDYFGNGSCPEGWDPEYWYDMRNYLEELDQDQRIASRRFDTCFEEGGIEPEFSFGYRVANRAIDFIERHADQDYFLVVSFDEPHHPFLAPQKYFELFQQGQPTEAVEKYFEKANQQLDMSQMPEHIQIWHQKHPGKYLPADLGLLGSNAFISDQIGRVLAALKQQGDKGLVIYTSDHGESCASHGIQSKGPAMYEEITNIPLIMKWNQCLPANLSLAAEVSHIQIVPTVLEFFGRTVPDSLEGNSLWNQLLPDSVTELGAKVETEALLAKDLQPEKPIFIEFNRYEIDHDGFGGFQPIRCIVKNRIKLVINLLTQDELYDLSCDPEELTNRIDDPSYQLIRDECHEELLEHMNATRDPLRGYYWRYRKWYSQPTKPHWNGDGKMRSRHREAEEDKELDYSTGLPIQEQERSY